MVDRLGVPNDSRIRSWLDRENEASRSHADPPYDQIFGMLQRDYLRPRVEREVSNALKTPRNASRRCHDITLRLSSDKAGRPFLVTTNFDLLFERARKRLRRWLPPHLPDMKTSHNPEGVVYLHGRRQTARSRSNEPSELVLSSSDFGRAYLADGWATRFVKQLLERRFVVLLGYSAGDPPVRYLLEGLDASASTTRERIFAFDRGEPDEVKGRWEGLGVTTIPYADHKLLWDSLEEWAARADDPMQWKQGAVRLAQQSPSSLQTFERGQIAALVATKSGAKAFSRAEPPPPAEWLCVLDKLIRFHEIWQDPETGTKVDPLATYGLDDDPPRPPSSPYQRSAPTPAIDLLCALPEDESLVEDRLSNIIPARSRSGNERLQELRFWISRVAHQPAAIWWAVRQDYLHPDVADAISWRLRKGSPQPIEGEARRIWALLLEIESDKPADPNEFRWSAACDAVASVGWTPQTLRQLERALLPRLVAKPNWHLSAPPTCTEATDKELNDLLMLEVDFPSINDGKVEIDKDALPEIFKAVRHSFERAVSLLSDTGFYAKYFHLAAIEPEDHLGNRHIDPGGPDPIFFWALRLFDQLAERHPSAARKEALTWPDPDQFFFDKLRIYVCTKSEIFSNREIARRISDLTDETFWNGYLKRELLHMLRARWPSLSQTSRRNVERRLLKGPPRYSTEEADAYEDRRAFRSGSRLGWLESQDCQLSKAALRRLRELRSHPGWKTSWEANADGDLDGRVGIVQQTTDPEDLVSLPIRRIAERSAELSSEDGSPFIKRVPFEGLVKARPRHALRALTFEARQGRYPAYLWIAMLRNWPEDTGIRPRRVFALRLALAPQETLLEARFDVPAWISKHLASVQQLEQEEFLVWDAMFDALAETAPSSTQSHLGDTTVAGNRQKTRKTHMHALNSPIGQLTQSLIEKTSKKHMTPEPLPSEISERLERASQIPGEGADHAISMMAQKLHWFFGNDPDWTKAVLLPAFDLDSPRCEAAWRGYLLVRRPPPGPDLFDLLKLRLLAVIENSPFLLGEDGFDRKICYYVVIGVVSSPVSRISSG